MHATVVALKSYSHPVSILQTISTSSSLSLLQSMNSTVTEDNTDTFKRESTALTNDGPSATIPSWIKPSSSRKKRILSHRQPIGKSSALDLQTNRTMTAINRPSSKLPNLLSTSHHQTVTAGKRLFVLSLLIDQIRFNTTSTRNKLVEVSSTAVTAETRSAIHCDQRDNTFADTLFIVQCR
jgi:hypothetical protein